MAPPRKVTMGSNPPKEEAPKKIEAVVEEQNVEPDVNEEKVDIDNENESYQPYTLEDLDPETPLWLDGPIVKEVLAWKKQYGDVYVTNVNTEKHIIWRTLKRSEYKHLVMTIEKLIQTGEMTQTEAGMYNEELTVEICSLFPVYENKDFDDELAGIPAIISQQILESSGFTTIDVRLL